jgi:GxxExxY protein
MERDETQFREAVALEHGEITEQVIGAAFEVYRVLGYGFLEKVYQRALQVELEFRGLTAELEPPIRVEFKGFVVGEYKSDLLVERRVMVELKATRRYQSEHEALLINQLKGTNTRVGLLINFGRTRVEFKRLVF